MIFLRKAVLIIHGYAGGTYDEEELANCLEKNWNLDVYSYTLPGHEKRIRKTIKYDEWIKASEKQLERLISFGYKKIYVVGHSMGGVIATYLATKYNNVKKLVLIAPAFRYIVNDDNAKFMDLLVKSKDMIKKNDKEEVLTRFLKLPISELSEFRELIKNYKNYINDVKIPTLVIQGKLDTIVPMESSIDIMEKIKSKNKKLVLLDNSTHDVFRCDDKNKAISEIEKFLK